MFLEILIASIVGSVIALIGGLLLLWKENFAKKISLFFVSFAAGSLLGAAFFDLLPEALEATDDIRPALSWLVGGILFLFLFEKLLKWHHCHNHETYESRTFSSTVLFGDTVHNFIDGVVIALSFSLGTEIGIAATGAVFLHEIPQEIGDFGVLLHAGWEKKKIILVNLGTAVATIVGAVIGYFALPYVSSILPLLIGFSAGTFIYIAVSDLMPEVQHKSRPGEFFHFLTILLGVLVIAGFNSLLGGH